MHVWQELERGDAWPWLMNQVRDCTMQSLDQAIGQLGEVVTPIEARQASLHLTVRWYNGVTLSYLNPHWGVVLSHASFVPLTFL